jgi:hypothetical protein
MEEFPICKKKGCDRPVKNRGRHGHCGFCAFAIIRRAKHVLEKSINQYGKGGSTNKKLRSQLMDKADEAIGIIRKYTM